MRGMAQRRRTQGGISDRVRKKARDDVLPPLFANDVVEWDGRKRGRRFHNDVRGVTLKAKASWISFETFRERTKLVRDVRARKAMVQG